MPLFTNKFCNSVFDVNLMNKAKYFNMLSYTIRVTVQNVFNTISKEIDTNFLNISIAVSNYLAL